MKSNEFAGDDTAYLAWLARHPHGFVVNRYAGNSAAYMVLHTAGCPLISQLPGNASAGGFTERKYIKVCAPDRQALVDYVRAHGRSDGSFSRECSRCKPGQR